MSRRLLDRLEEIGRSVARTGRADALIGLGSVGQDVGRLDEFSDLDFFVIARPGYKEALISDLSWLDSICPLAFSFRNTVDGWKVLFDDGIFAEFAVFERDEMQRIPFTPGRLIWHTTQVTDEIVQPASMPAMPEKSSMEWQIGEALSNLYVGMCRYLRGEKLSAARLIQHYAVDRVIALHEIHHPGASTARDPFSSERRLEQRCPEFSRLLPSFVRGYDHIPASTLSILDHLCANCPVNPIMEKEIRQLCARGLEQAGKSK